MNHTVKILISMSVKQKSHEVYILQNGLHKSKTTATTDDDGDRQPDGRTDGQTQTNRKIDR